MTSGSDKVHAHMHGIINVPQYSIQRYARRMTSKWLFSTQVCWGSMGIDCSTDLKLLVLDTKHLSVVDKTLADILGEAAWSNA